ncbi:MAG: GxxExxY protein [Candidatus Marinimicrobia bacterium]|nr:GxxExxY protein [Candidatus Neomarinimicrobiota bacterium]
MDNLLYKDEVYSIVGVAIEVHKEMGPGFLEAVYEECMAIESQAKKIPFETQVELSVNYKGRPLNKKYIADYIAYGKIIVEFKCIPKLTNIEEAQILNYLKVTGLKVGLLINFGSKGKLEWKRYIKTL